MKGVHQFERVYLHRHPVDMRKGINGLVQIVVAEQMGVFNEPNLFVFVGKRRNTVKVLYYDMTGFSLWIHQLEKNRFFWPKTEEDTVVLTATQFDWLLQGINIWKMESFKKVEFQHFF